MYMKTKGVAAQGLRNSGVQERGQDPRELKRFNLQMTVNPGARLEEEEGTQ